MSPSFLFQKTKLHASMRGKKGKLWLMQKQSGIHKWGRYHMVKSIVAIYNQLTWHAREINQNSTPLFIWTEKEGWPTLERGVSSLTTSPELPTLPFHLDLPICNRKQKRKDVRQWWINNTRSTIFTCNHRCLNVRINDPLNITMTKWY